MEKNIAKLTTADLQFYEEKGYWISPKLLDDEQIARLRHAHERVWAGDYDGDGYAMYGHISVPSDPHQIRKLDNAWWINDEVRDVVTDPIIGEMAAYLMQTNEVRLWHDQLIYKPSAGSTNTQAGNVGWHQDYGYWQASSNPNMITVWIALQDTDLKNGGMMSVNGSHKWGLIPDSDTFFDQDMNKLKEKYTADSREWVEEPCILPAGHASFHHSLTFHGSGQNVTNEPRLSVVAHLMPYDTFYRPGVQFHHNVTLLGARPEAGQRFANDNFPILYSK
ncbi:phytanoyl-CoA dioxygenase family protein [Paenibacillus yanchengensis]|uniref:Phytanoyl-CoA dioxygenase family protein n=1 Tax=Paenibacillus yanchengensis TaxID=2035833 RepID=A0ABW4YR07_9BACL